MSSIPSQFKEYIWLVNSIRRAKRISFEELQGMWLQTDLSGGVEYAKSTFHRHKDAIQDIFGIFIDCDRQNGYKYFIGNDNVLREDTIQNWMISTITVNNIVGESLSIQDRIVLEQIPCTDFLQTFIDAMKKRVRVKVSYKRYGTDTESHSDFEPYCIKLFERRWYVLGHFYRAATPEMEEHSYFALFSFDRIIDVNLTDIKFEIDPCFDAKTYFDECYGVVVGDGTPVEHIVIRAFGKERFYMRDLPLHHSQKELAFCDDYADFSLDVRPTFDFIGKLMSLGKNIKVISPKSLADRLLLEFKEATELYKE